MKIPLNITLSTFYKTCICLVLPIKKWRAIYGHILGPTGPRTMRNYAWSWACLSWEKLTLKTVGKNLGITSEISEPVTNFPLPLVAYGMVAAFPVGLYPAAYFPWGALCQGGGIKSGNWKHVRFGKSSSLPRIRRAYSRGAEFSVHGSALALTTDT